MDVAPNFRRPASTSRLDVAITEFFRVSLQLIRADAQRSSASSEHLFSAFVDASGRAAHSAIVVEPPEPPAGAK